MWKGASLATPEQQSNKWGVVVVVVVVVAVVVVVVVCPYFVVDWWQNYQKRQITIDTPDYHYKTRCHPKYPRNTLCSQSILQPLYRMLPHFKSISTRYAFLYFILLFTECYSWPADDFTCPSPKQLGSSPPLWINAQHLYMMSDSAHLHNSANTGRFDLEGNNKIDIPHYTEIQNSWWMHVHQLVPDLNTDDSYSCLVSIWIPRFGHIKFMIHIFKDRIRQINIYYWSRSALIYRKQIALSSITLSWKCCLVTGD